MMENVPLDVPLPKMRRALRAYADGRRTPPRRGIQNMNRVQDSVHPTCYFNSMMQIVLRNHVVLAPLLESLLAARNTSFVHKCRPARLLLNTVYRYCNADSEEEKEALEIDDNFLGMFHFAVFDRVFHADDLMYAVDGVQDAADIFQKRLMHPLNDAISFDFKSALARVTLHLTTYIELDSFEQLVDLSVASGDGHSMSEVVRVECDLEWVHIHLVDLEAEEKGSEVLSQSLQSCLRARGQWMGDNAPQVQLTFGAPRPPFVIVARPVEGQSLTWQEWFRVVEVKRTTMENKILRFVKDMIRRCVLGDFATDLLIRSIVDDSIEAENSTAYYVPTAAVCFGHMHYTALCRSLDRPSQWYHFNDSSVKCLNLTNPNDFKKWCKIIKTAVVFFYHNIRDSDVKKYQSKMDAAFAKLTAS